MIFWASALRSVSGRSKLKSKDGDIICLGGKICVLNGVWWPVAATVGLEGVEAI